MHLSVNSILRLSDLLSLFSFLHIRCMREVRWCKKSVRQVDSPQVFIISELRMIETRATGFLHNALYKISVNFPFSSLPPPPNKQESTIELKVVPMSGPSEHPSKAQKMPSREPYSSRSGLILVKIKTCCNPKPSYSLASFKCINVIWEQKRYPSTLRKITWL